MESERESEDRERMDRSAAFHHGGKTWQLSDDV
jgi:hypothetical protein